MTDTQTYATSSLPSYITEPTRVENKPQAELTLSMDTLVAMSPLLGYPLVNRSPIRHGQNPDLADALSAFVPGSQLPCLPKDEFFFGSVDLMMTRNPDTQAPEFYVVEVNGSNAAGLTDVPVNSIEAIIDSISASLDCADLPTPSVVLNSYTGERNINLHERIVLAEGIKARHPELNFKFVPSNTLENEDFQFDPEAISFVIGPISHVLPHMNVSNGRLHIKENPVAVIINDLTIDRITKSLPEFAQDAVKDRTLILNRIHPLLNLKARTYELLKNRIEPALSGQYPLKAFEYWEADSAETLEALSLDLVLNQKQSIVIKPYASSVGLGIAFLNPEMSEAEVKETVAKSIEETLGRNKGLSNVFPYSICRFVETSLCNMPSRELYNRKFDLRIFVVRKDDGFYAIPGVIKLASKEYDTASFHREGLQTNTMRLTQQSPAPMEAIFATLIQPFNNPVSLEAIGLDLVQVKQICEMSAHVVGHLVAAFREQRSR